MTDAERIPRLLSRGLRSKSCVQPGGNRHSYSVCTSAGSAGCLSWTRASRSTLDTLRTMPGWSQRSSSPTPTTESPMLVRHALVVD